MSKLLTILLATVFAGAAYAHDLPASADTSGHVLVDHPKATTDANIEKGKGDAYGTILKDTGSHTPHTPGDRHAAEKGKGDSYGSALFDADKKMKH